MVGLTAEIHGGRDARQSRSAASASSSLRWRLLSTSAGGSGGGYSIRAIFDDAGNLTIGEDVKVDGVKVGTVESVTPTPQAKAAVVLKIDNPGFRTSGPTRVTIRRRR